nr:leucine-rich repeat extensin-like protein 5 [Aegilops tauschii subsp. strangulata]
MAAPRHPTPLAVAHRRLLAAVHHHRCPIAGATSPRSHPTASTTPPHRTASSSPTRLSLSPTSSTIASCPTPRGEAPPSSAFPSSPRTCPARVHGHRVHGCAPSLPRTPWPPPRTARRCSPPPATAPASAPQPPAPALAAPCSALPPTSPCCSCAPLLLAKASRSCAAGRAVRKPVCAHRQAASAASPYCPPLSRTDACGLPTRPQQHPSAPASFAGDGRPASPAVATGAL